MARVKRFQLLERFHHTFKLVVADKFLDENMKPINVVLVEDHALTRIGLRKTLECSDRICVLGEAATGKTGLALILQQSPDVAIVDIGLPDMDGIELTRRYRTMRGDADCAPTKILVLTMHDSEDSILSAFASGADSYCLKDIKTHQLMKAVEMTDAGNSWIDPAIANVVLRHLRDAHDQGGDHATASDTLASYTRLSSSTNGATAATATLAPQSVGTVAIASIDPEYQETIEASPLTARELEVLELIVAGYSNAEMAERLHVAMGTIKTHVRNVLAKLCASDRTQAAVRALRAGLVP